MTIAALCDNLFLARVSANAGETLLYNRIILFSDVEALRFGLLFQGGGFRLLCARQVRGRVSSRRPFGAANDVLTDVACAPH